MTENKMELAGSPTGGEKEHEPEQKETEIATKLREGISRRLSADLRRFRPRLSENQITAYEKALREIREVETVDEAERALKTLFDVILHDAEEIPDEDYARKDGLLAVAQEIAELKTPYSLVAIANEKIIQY